MSTAAGAVPETRARRALVYGHVNLNLIDGSAIWVQGIVEALARAGAQTDLLLKAPVLTGRLVDPLRALPGVRLRRPFEDKLLAGLEAKKARERGLSPTQACEAIRMLDAAAAYDLVIVRGLSAVAALAEAGVAAGRLWTYLTDVPQSHVEADAEAVRRLGDIAAASRYLLCQTEELRAFLEGLVPEACGKAVLFPPVTPQVDGVASTQPPPPGQPLRLVYTGKYAQRWNTEAMAALPAKLAAKGVPTELHMVGDKVHDEPSDPGFADRMQHALEHGAGVVWHGGVARERAMQIAGTAHLGLSWRDADLDDSLELSTKVLEYGALGLPAVLNRTPMHERLLGADYPLFAAGSTARTVEDDLDAVVDMIAAVAADPDRYRLAAERTAGAARAHTMTTAADRLERLLRAAFPAAPAVLAGRTRPLRVVVAGHDMKFFTRIADQLEATPGIELRLDHWTAVNRHDEERSREHLAWADVIICEWCGSNAAWYSRHKRAGQRLIVRLHRFELFTKHPGNVRIDAVDTVVCVNRHYAQLTARLTGWPAEKISVIPNWVDADQLDRAKLTGAQFNLGMIGVTPARKRFDLGLDVLAALRREDRRFHLFVKSKMPWDYGWIWQDPAERGFADDVLRRLRTDPFVRDAVVFDGFGPDVPAWLRGVGWVLSTSDDESFHLSPAEGMASGAVPAVLPWPGADTVYPAQWMHDSPAQIAAAIRAATAGEDWDRQRRQARDQVRSALDLPVVCAAFLDLITGTRPADPAVPVMASEARP